MGCGQDFAFYCRFGGAGSGCGVAQRLQWGAGEGQGGQHGHGGGGRSDQILNSFLEVEQKGFICQLTVNQFVMKGRGYQILILWRESPTLERRRDMHNVIGLLSGVPTRSYDC